MKIYQEIKLQDFTFWSGAKDTAACLTTSDFDQIEEILKESHGNDGMSETQINNLFWFESDTVAEWLGFENWEEFAKTRELPTSTENWDEMSVYDKYHIIQREKCKQGIDIFAY